MLICILLNNIRITKQHICLHASSFFNTQLSLIFPHPAPQLKFRRSCCTHRFVNEEKLTISQSFMQLTARGLCKKLEKFERSFQWMFSISVRDSRRNHPLEKIRHFGNFVVPVPTPPRIVESWVR